MFFSLVFNMRFKILFNERKNHIEIIYILGLQNEILVLLKANYVQTYHFIPPLKIAITAKKVC